jgi:hypothetical protein
MSAKAMVKVSNKLAKVERTRLREDMKAYDVNKEYLPWALIDYDIQIEICSAQSIVML